MISWSTPRREFDCNRIRQKLFRGHFGRLHLRAQFVNKDALVFGIVDGHHDEMDAAAFERGLERRDEVAALGYPRSLRAVTLGISNEIRVAEGQAKIREIVDGLFPTDHPVR